MSDILKSLNVQQKQAVQHATGPLMIVAGAGTGKTTVITRRIAYLIEKKLAKPSEILALTFTDKAAGEMEERVDVLVPYGYVDTWISTFHAFGDRILRENALDLGLSPDFRVLTRPEQIMFFQSNLFSFDLDYYRPLSNPTKFIDAILSFISRCKDENISPEDYLEYVKKLKDATNAENAKDAEIADNANEIKRQEELANVYKRYEELKTAAGLLDFGDQVQKPLELFRTRPKILAKYQQKFKYLLVDEYQDTNWAQGELVNLLAQKQGNITVVLDDDQAIYRWRGASMSNFLNFQKNFPKVKLVALTQNYRSSQAILDSAYKLIQHNNPDRLEAQSKIDKKLKSQKPNYGQPPKELYGATLSEETDLVASEIKKLVAGKKLRYRDIAILVRANSQVPDFMQSANCAGIPHKFTGSSGLYDREEIRLLISFLKFITTLDDSLNLYNLAVSDLYQLPVSDCIKCMDLARRKNWPLSKVFFNLANLPQLELASQSVEIISRILADFDRFSQMSQKENVGRVLYEFLIQTGYLKQLEKENTVESTLKIQNIAKFFDKISEFKRLAQNESSSQFIQYLELMRDAGEDPSTAELDPDLDAVNITTIHSAKGLEFPIVFMVNLVSDRFPSRERSETIPVPNGLIKETLPTGDFHLQEERRLFYVGMTRAVEKLYFCWSRDYGGKRLRKVSPFVLEALDKPQADAEVVKQSPLEKIKRHGVSSEIVKSNAKQLPEKEILRLNQQQIDDYLTCPQKYYYSSILRIPILKHHSVVYGYALHLAVQEFFRQKMQSKILPLEEMLRIFEDAWESEGFLSAEHEAKRLDQGRLILVDFWNREKANKEKPVSIEKEFRASLDDVLLIGRWDRVDQTKDGARIIDFKSSENVDLQKAKTRAKESVQLRVYALSYQKIYGRLPKSVGLYFLESGVVGEFEPTEEIIKEVTEEISQVEKGIRSQNFCASPGFMSCNYCAYSLICPYTATKI